MFPDLRPRPAFRLAGELAVGAAFDNTDVLQQLVPTSGSARLRVRIKTATAGGTLDIVLYGPDTDPDRATLTGTGYTTGNPTQVTVSSGTEAKIDVDLYGENFALVKFTGTGTGTVTYADVSQV